MTVVGKTCRRKLHATNNRHRSHRRSRNNGVSEGWRRATCPLEGLEYRRASGIAEAGPDEIFYRFWQIPRPNVAIGIGCGLAIAVIGSKAIASQLYGVTPKYAAAYLGVALLFWSVGLTAAVAPVVRATRIDPLRSLNARS